MLHPDTLRRLPPSIARTVVRTIVNQEEKANGRTRTADLISLRVCGQWLLSVAEDCKARISKGVSILSIAHYCRVLRPG
jgi:hypothetical protein